jgi:hypothetical protein
MVGRLFRPVGRPLGEVRGSTTFIRIGFKDIEDAKDRRNHCRRMATALHKHSCFFCFRDGKRVMGGKSGSLWTAVA